MAWPVGWKENTYSRGARSVGLLSALSFHQRGGIPLILWSGSSTAVVFMLSETYLQLSVFGSLPIAAPPL